MTQRLYTLITFLLCAVCLHAQSREDIANLFQDVQLLKSEIGQLRLENQRLVRENQDLRTAIQNIYERQDALADNYNILLSELNRQIKEAKAEMQAAGNLQKDQILAAVEAQLKNFEASTKTAIAQVSAGGTTTTKTTRIDKDVITSNMEWRTDFPSTGIAYTVVKGDNLSTIAKKHGSKATWIQHANKIVDPRKDVRVGMTLFIPQPE